MPITQRHIARPVVYIPLGVSVSSAPFLAYREDAS
jgi:hypothetical protein